MKLSIIWETFIEKSVNAGRVPYSSKSFLCIHFFLSFAVPFCFYVFRVEFLMLNIPTRTL